MKKLFFIFFIQIFEHSICIKGMDHLVSRKIPCHDIQEASWLDNTTLLLNTMKTCYTLNLKTEEKKIIKKYRNYHEMISHPTKPWLITLSDHKGITLYNYQTKEFTYFKTPYNYYDSTINHCTFSPRNPIIYFHNRDSIYSLDYQSGEIIDL